VTATARLRRAQAWAWGLLFVAVCASSALLVARPSNPDVSWGLTLGDRLLDGARLYRDVLETNPPMTVFLYLPASFAGRLTGVAPELLLIGGTALGFVLALLLALRALRGSPVEGGPSLLITLWTVCGWLMWLASFAEREHLAVIALLPGLAVWQVRAEGRPVDRLSMAAAGLGGGLATAIKPFFCLCLILPALLTVVRRRELRAALAPEYVIAAAVASLYGLTVLTLFPAYLQAVVPVLRDTYLAYRLSPRELLARPEWLLALCWIGVLFWVRPGWLATSASWATAALLAGVAFFVAYLLQGKGYANHLLPSVALIGFGGLGLMAPVAAAALRDEVTPFLRRGVTLVATAWAAATLAALTLQLDRPVPLRSLALLGPIARLPAARTLLAVSPDLDVGHPLARSAGLRYVGSDSSLWLTGSALERRSRPGADAAIRARMDRYVADDLQRLCADIARARPDLVVLDRARLPLPFLRREAPGVADALGGYRPVAERNGLDLLARRGGAGAPACARSRPPGA
jgi:hypothetical protein